MAANNSNDSETYHEVPASKYWYLGDAIGAVPKGFFQFWTPFLIIGTATVTSIACLTNWWQLFFTAAFTYIYIKNWMISLPITGLSLGVLYIWRNQKGKHKRALQNERARIRKYQDAEIANHEVKQK